MIPPPPTFGWFSTDKLSIRFLPERCESRAWVLKTLVCFLCDAFFPGPIPGAVRFFSSNCPSNGAGEQQSGGGVGAAGHESVLRARLQKM